VGLKGGVKKQKNGQIRKESEKFYPEGRQKKRKKTEGF